MRISYVCPGLGHGGAETQLIALAAALRSQGHAVQVLTLFPGTARVAHLRSLGVEVVEHEKRSRLDWALVRSLRQRLRQFKPDLVHGFLFDGNLYSRLAAWGLGIPVLSAERNSDYTLRRSQQLAHGFTRHLTAAVVANSHAGADLARQMYPALAGDRVHVVWNGIDSAAVSARAAAAAGLRQQIGAGPTDRLVCFIGSTKPEKDLLLAVSVVRLLLADTDVRWHAVFLGGVYKPVAGYRVVEHETSQQYAAQVEQAFDTLPAARVHRLGVVDKVIEVVSQCDVLLSTSTREGFPNVVLEAMAAGTPVVSTRYSDIDRILPLAWQVADDREADSLAALVRRAVREQSLVRQAQHNWVASHATIDRSAAALLAVYRRWARA